MAARRRLQRLRERHQHTALREKRLNARRPPRRPPNGPDTRPPWFVCVCAVWPCRDWPGFGGIGVRGGRIGGITDTIPYYMCQGMALHALSDLIFSIKDKLTDREYLEIMNCMGAISKSKINQKAIMEDFGLDEPLAFFIIQCLTDAEYGAVFSFVDGEIIPSHLIFDARPEPSRHPMATRSRASAPSLEH